MENARVRRQIHRHPPSPIFAADETVPISTPMAQKLDCSGHHRLLDIAGGSGIYACALVARHPHLRAAVLEKPPVDAITRCQSLSGRQP